MPDALFSGNGNLGKNHAVDWGRVFSCKYALRADILQILQR
jgi:hypothetical protein